MLSISSQSNPETNTIESILKEHLSQYLVIQTLSKVSLSIETDYIDIDLVRYSVKQEDYSDEILISRQPPINGIARVDTGELIRPDDLFEPLERPTHLPTAPERILVQGVKGIGKTTLAKKIVHDALHKDLWQDRFDWVIWIPLEHLAQKPLNDDLNTFLHDEYFKDHPNGYDLTQALLDRIKATPSRTLFVLDGWNEWVEEKTLSLFGEHLNQVSILLTTSSPTVYGSQFYPFTLKTQLLGFNSAGINRYIEQRHQPSLKNINDIKTLIQNQTQLQSLLKIPIHLDALCTSWDAIKASEHSTTTMTGLYQALVTQLCCQHSVGCEGTPSHEESTVSLHQKPLAQHIEKLSSYLGRLALHGIVKNQTQWIDDDLSDTYQQLVQEHSLSSSMPTLNTYALPFLESNQNEHPEHPMRYRFLSSTVQDFFAAQWLAHCLNEPPYRRPSQTSDINVDAWIQAHKYDPRYATVWCFLAGKLKRAPLKRFFNSLHQGSQDLIGIQHHYLMSQCLNETESKLPEEQRLLESSLDGWLAFRVRSINSSDQLSFLGCQPTCPEHLLFERLKAADRLCQANAMLERTIQDSHTLSDSVINYCNELSAHKDHMRRAQERRDTILKTLSYRHLLSDHSLQQLAQLTKHPDQELRCWAVKALGQKKDLSTNYLQCLVTLLRDNSQTVRSLAATVLDRHHASSNFVDSWITVLLHKEHLESQSYDLSTHIPSIIELLHDDNQQVRALAVDRLSQQRLLPRHIDDLITLFSDSNDNTLHSVQAVLRQQPSLAEPHIEHLLTLLQHEKQYTSCLAAGILGQQRLSPKHVDLLITLLRPEHSYIEYSIEQLLKQDLGLSSENSHRLSNLHRYDPKLDLVEYLLNKRKLAPEFVDPLMTLLLLQDEEVPTSYSAPSLLAQQVDLSPIHRQRLNNLLNDWDKRVGSLVASLLSQQRLSPDSAHSLITLLSDTGHLARSAKSVLQQQSDWSTRSLNSLFALLTDENPEVSAAAADIISNQKLAPEFVASLMTSLKHAHHSIVHSAERQLEQTSSISLKNIQRFIVFSKNRYSSISASIMQILPQQIQLPSGALGVLVNLAKEQDFDSQNGFWQSVLHHLSDEHKASMTTLTYLTDLAKASHAKAHIVESIERVLVQQLCLSTNLRENLLLLLNEENWGVTQSVAYIFSHQHNLSPETIDTLIRLSNDKESNTEYWVAQALVNQASLAPSHLSYLVDLCRGGDIHRQRLALETVGAQAHLLAPKDLETMIDLLGKDNHYDLSYRLAQGISQSQLSSQLLNSLVRLFEDKRWTVLPSITKLIGQAPHLPFAVVERLIELLQHGDQQIRSDAATALGNQTHLTTKAIDALIQLAKDETNTLRQLGAVILGQRVNASPEIRQRLIEASTDDAWDTRLLAVRALGHLLSVSNEIITCLADRLEDVNSRVRCIAHQRLSREPIWRGYRLLPTASPSLIQALYQHWFIPCQSQQLVPLYLKDHQLCFYTLHGLESIPLDEAVIHGLKQAIFKAKKEMRIPTLSLTRMTATQVDWSPATSSFFQHIIDNLPSQERALTSTPSSPK